MKLQVILHQRPRLRRLVRCLAWLGLVAASAIFLTWIVSARYELPLPGGPSPSAMTLWRGRLRSAWYANTNEPGWVRSPAGNSWSFDGPDGFYVDWFPKWWSTADLRLVCLPLWIPFMLTTLGALVAWRASKRVPGGTCPTCGYSLLGLPSVDRCPECGATSQRGHPAN